MSNDDWLNPQPQTFRNFAVIWEGLYGTANDLGWCTFESNGTISAESWHTDDRFWHLEVGLTKVAMYAKQGDRPTIFINSGIDDFPFEEAKQALANMAEES